MSPAARAGHRNPVVASTAHSPMGSLCSKTGSHSSGHTVGSTSDRLVAASSSPGPRPAPGSAAANAAEARSKSAQTRGTSASNPKRGQLAAKVEAAKSAKVGPENKDDRLVWD
jgi:hypothetical protein